MEIPTTNKEMHMIHSVNKDLVTRMFAKFAIVYGKLWTTRLGEDGDWQACADDWLGELSQFSEENLRAAVNKALTMYRDFPPTLGQLIDLCLKESGVPDIQAIIQLMVDRNFTHPIVKMIYDKIGSWSLSRDTTDEVLKKTKEHYQKAVSEFYVYPEQSWRWLESTIQKPNELPKPETPPEKPLRSLKEQLDIYRKKSQEAMDKADHVQEICFPENEITPGHRDFNAELYEEYRQYLINTPETKVLTLPPKHAYQRMRFIAQMEQPALLKKAGYIQPHLRTPEEHRRSDSKRYGSYDE